MHRGAWLATGVAAAALGLTALAVTHDDPMGTSCADFLLLSNSQQIDIAMVWAAPDPSARRGPPWTEDQAARELTNACQQDPTKIIRDMGVAWFGREP